MLYDELSAIENRRYFAALYTHPGCACVGEVQGDGPPRRVQPRPSPHPPRRPILSAGHAPAHPSLARVLQADPELLLLSTSPSPTSTSPPAQQMKSSSSPTSAPGPHPESGRQQQAPPSVPYHSPGPPRPAHCGHHPRPPPKARSSRQPHELPRPPPHPPSAKMSLPRVALPRHHQRHALLPRCSSSSSSPSPSSPTPPPLARSSAASSGSLCSSPPVTALNQAWNRELPQRRPRCPAPRSLARFPRSSSAKPSPTFSSSSALSSYFILTPIFVVFYNLHVLGNALAAQLWSCPLGTWALIVRQRYLLRRPRPAHLATASCSFRSSFCPSPCPRCLPWCSPPPESSPAETPSPPLCGSGCSPATTSSSPSSASSSSRNDPPRRIAAKWVNLK